MNRLMENALLTIELCAEAQCVALFKGSITSKFIVSNTYRS